MSILDTDIPSDSFGKKTEIFWNKLESTKKPKRKTGIRVPKYHKTDRMPCKTFYKKGQ